MMAESSTRKVGLLKRDRISELPQNIQETILCSLPIRDAVRTSILSRTWKYRWTVIPHLIFDEEFVDSVIRKYGQDDHADIQLLRTHKLACVLNKVLLLHNGPILKLSLKIPGDECYPEIIHEYIDQWIPLLSRNGIKQLMLRDYVTVENMSHNFSSLDLTHLRLTEVCFAYKPTYGRFTYLKKLELIEGGYNNSVIGIFDCPVLEKLTLIACTGLFPNNFCAPKLKCLHQVCHLIPSEYSLAGLENLKEYSFWLWGGYSYMEDLISKTKKSNVVKIFAWVPNIKKLSITMMCEYLAAGGAAGGAPNRLSKPLLYLKTMNISDINFSDLSEISCLFCLIRSAPNLCKLNISADWYGEGGDLENYWIEDSEDFTIGHLEIVTFSEFKGRQAELELVRFLLAHSPSLKTMFIHRSHFMSKDVALTVLEKMLKYSRSSSRAQISHLSHSVKIDEYDEELWEDVEIL